MGYTERGYGDYLILYTTDLLDAMPIGNVTVGPQPCLNSSHISRPEDWPPLFELENDASKPKCEKLDQRFEDIGFTTNELAVQKSSGVLQKLKKLPGYDVSDESKEAAEYHVWTRPTTSWKCSKLEMTQTFDAINNATLSFKKPVGILA